MRSELKAVPGETGRVGFGVAPEDDRISGKDAGGCPSRQWRLSGKRKFMRRLTGCSLQLINSLDFIARMERCGVEQYLKRI
jgi:hypothetical protein